MASRTSPSVLAAALLGIVIATLNPESNPPAVPAAVITYLDQPSDAEREVVEWAAERFLEAGLNLPDLTISFPATCGGKAGAYYVGHDHIDLCHLSHRLVLHEFGHAWDDNTTVDREEFMKRRGVDHWYEQEGRRSHESGGEQLAHVIAWGLMDIDTTSRESEYAGQPIDEQPRYLRGAEGADAATLSELFIEVTGVQPLVPAWVGA